jgi:hypothetical protein
MHQGIKSGKAARKYQLHQTEIRQLVLSLQKKMISKDPFYAIMNRKK